MNKRRTNFALMLLFPAVAMVIDQKSIYRQLGNLQLNQNSSELVDEKRDLKIEERRTEKNKVPKIEDASSTTTQFTVSF